MYINVGILFLISKGKIIFFYKLPHVYQRVPHAPKGCVDAYACQVRYILETQVSVVPQYQHFLLLHYLYCRY